MRAARCRASGATSRGKKAPPIMASSGGSPPARPCRSARIPASPKANPARRTGCREGPGQALPARRQPQRAEGARDRQYNRRLQQTNPEQARHVSRNDLAVRHAGRDEAVQGAVLPLLVQPPCANRAAKAKTMYTPKAVRIWASAPPARFPFGDSWVTSTDGTASPRTSACATAVAHVSSLRRCSPHRAGSQARLALSCCRLESGRNDQHEPGAARRELAFRLFPWNCPVGRSVKPDRRQNDGTSRFGLRPRYIPSAVRRPGR